MRFCEYADDDEIPKGCASKSRDRLDQRMNPDVDVEEDNSDSDDGSSSSHGSASDEEILRELGPSELNLDDDNNESDYVNATKTIENLRSFRILWESLSRWETPSTVELVLSITIPEPIGVGVMDWSLKRRLRLECVPGRCLPQSFSLSSYDEGRLHQMALQHLSRMNDDSGKIWSQRLERCGNGKMVSEHIVLSASGNSSSPILHIFVVQGVEGCWDRWQ